MRKNAADTLLSLLRLKLSWLPAAQEYQGPLMEISGTVAIVFLIVPDPVGPVINDLARPGGNAGELLDPA